MNHIIPIWRQILSEEGLRTFKFTNGPSIPFLIGIYYYYKLLKDDDLQSSVCVRKILIEILESEDCQIDIAICPTLGVAIIRNTTKKGLNTLVIETVDEWVNKLWRDYGKFIKLHRFSIDQNDHSWREYAEDELRNIKTIKV